MAQTEVAHDWALKPSGLGPGDQFRLIFASSTTRNANSTDIANYNTFVQNRAAAGHSAIQSHSSGFRVVGCTEDVDARDNTSTTGTGVPIYWLSGNKVADDYADFYDGSWDDEANSKDESGNDRGLTSLANQPFTGCDHDGTEAAGDRALGDTSVRLGTPNGSGASHGPLSGNANTGPSSSRPFYGLSEVFQVRTPFTATFVAGEIFAALDGDRTVGRQYVDLKLSKPIWKSDWHMLTYVVRTNNGRTTSAERVSEQDGIVNGRIRPLSDHWRYTVQADDPSRPIRLRVDADQSCFLSFALCTPDGEQLSNSPKIKLWGTGEAPTLSLSGSSVPENKLSLLFTINVSYATPNGIRVRFRTLETGTATADDDYEAYDNTILIPPNTTTWPVAVWLHDDDVSESNETVIVEISEAHLVDSYGENTVALALRPAVATGTIEAPVTTMNTSGNGNIQIYGSDADEGRYIGITVSRSAHRDKRMCFDIETTSAGTATPGDDFVPIRKRRLWIEKNRTWTSFGIWAKHDDEDDPDETVETQISNAHLCEDPSQAPRILSGGTTLQTIFNVDSTRGDPRISNGSIVSGPGPDQVWNVGDVVTAQVRFNEQVTVDTTGGTPTLAVTLDEYRREARYADGTGTDTLSFHYEMTSTDGEVNWVEPRLDGLSLNGGRIQAAGGGEFEPSPVPTVSSVEVAPDPDGDGRWSSGEPVMVIVHFSQEVIVDTGGGTPSVSLLLPGGARDAPYASGSGTAELRFAYEMTATDEAATSVLVPQNGLALNGGQITDLSGTAAELGHPEAGDAGSPGPTTLTASFVDVPEIHDGENTFVLRLNLSGEIDNNGTPRRLRDALEVTGGELDAVWRFNEGEPNRIVRVQPTGNGPITVTLPATADCADPGALCTADGARLEEGASATIQGLPGISIKAASVYEAPGAKLEFEVELSRAGTSEITVDYATEDLDEPGSAEGGDRKSDGKDYKNKSGTLTFPPGKTLKYVRVKVYDDEHDEGSETMKVKLSNPVGAYIAVGEAIGTIRNSDAMPKAWIARFARGAVDHVEQAVKARMAAGREPGRQVTVAGQRFASGSEEALAALEAREADARHEMMSQWLRGERGDSWEVPLESRTLTGQELLAGTAFSLTDGTPDGGYGTVWGLGAISRFDGREDQLTLDGKIESVMLGTDFQRADIAAGLVLSHSRGTGSYQSGTTSGAVESRITGLYPWGRYTVNERLSFWGLGGYGQGSLTLTPEGQQGLETDMDLAAAALGFRGLITEAPAPGSPELAVTSDVLGIRTTSDAVRGERTGNLAAAKAHVTRLRLGLEGSWALRFGDEAALTPRLEMGVRHDGGDAETGYGLDIGAGVTWRDSTSGISAEVSARGLLAHDAEGFQDRGFSGTLAWDPKPDTDRGLALTLRQSVGASATSGMDALLERGTLEGLAANDDDLASRRMEATLGYGVGAFGDRFTAVPELGFGYSNDGHDLRLGWRLALEQPGASSMALKLEATRREAANDEAPEHGVGLSLVVGW